MRRSLAALVDEAAVSEEVVDIFAYAGLPPVRLDSLSPELLLRMQRTPADATALAIQQLRNLLAQETSRTASGNIVKSKYFADRIAEVMNRYTNASLTAVDVITVLFELAEEVREGARRGEKYDPPLGRDELAVYDALGDNPSALEAMGDETLAKIARELIAMVRRDSKMDWTVRDDVRARLRNNIKRLLVKYRSPPDKQAAATKLVLEQLEAFAPRYAAETSD